MFEAFKSAFREEFTPLDTEQDTITILQTKESSTCTAEKPWMITLTGSTPLHVRVPFQFTLVNWLYYTLDTELKNGYFRKEQFLIVGPSFVFVRTIFLPFKAVPIIRPDARRVKPLFASNLPRCLAEA